MILVCDEGEEAGHNFFFILIMDIINFFFGGINLFFKIN